MTTGFTVPLHQPTPAFSTRDFAQPSEDSAFAQPGHPTDLQYPGYLDAWNNYIGPAVNQPGDPYFDASFFNTSMGLVGGGQDFGFEYP